MIVNTQYVTIESGGSPMRTFVAAPKTAGEFSGVLMYSDIFQLTSSTLRCAVRLAGYGFVVAAPEIYHRVEPPGSAIPFDDAGRDRGRRHQMELLSQEARHDDRSRALRRRNRNRPISPRTLDRK